MRLAFYTILFIFLTVGLSAQLSVESSVVNGKSSSQRVALYFTVTNTSTETQTFYWDLDSSAALPGEWALSVCDTNTCYDWGADSCPCDEPAELGAGEKYTFTVNVDPNGVADNYEVDFRVTDKCENSKVIDKGTLSYSCLLYTSPSPRDRQKHRMPSSA